MENKPIRVLVSSLSRDFGGVESLFLDLCQYRDPSKITFDFLCSDQSAAREQDFLKTGAKVYHLPRPSKDKKGYLDRVNEILDKGNYQIFHMNMTRYYYPAAAALAKKKGLRIILHSHSTRIYKTKSIVINFVRQIEQIVFRPITLRISDANIACSKTAGEYLFGKREYQVIYNGIDLSKYRYSIEDRKQIRKEFNIPDDAFVLGHVGRFSLEKNHEYLLNVFKEVNHIHTNSMLICIGSGDLINQVKERAERLGLSNKIVFTGLRNDIPALLSAMDVFVFPSVHEALPMTLIEAQANGLPCVVSESVTREILANKNLYFLELSAGAESWAKVIDNESRITRSSASYQLEQFSINTMLNKLLDLYKNFS